MKVRREKRSAFQEWEPHSPAALQANFLHGEKFNCMRSPLAVTAIRIRDHRDKWSTRARLIVSVADYDEYSRPARSTASLPEEIDF